MNYFQLYDLPVSFIVDAQEVRKKFLALSKQFHPDFFTLDNAEKQQEILDISTNNNKAFQTLSDFDKRMKYILTEKGYVVEEEKYLLPQQFLIEMMELNELIMEYKPEGDILKKVEVIDAINRTDEQLLTKMNLITDNYSEATATEKDYHEIKEFYYKRKYLLRLREQLNKFAEN